MEVVGQHIISSKVGTESVFMLSEKKMGHFLLTGLPNSGKSQRGHFHFPERITPVYR